MIEAIQGKIEALPIECKDLLRSNIKSGDYFVKLYDG